MSRCTVKQPEQRSTHCLTLFITMPSTPSSLRLICSSTLCIA